MVDRCSNSSPTARLAEARHGSFVCGIEALLVYISPFFDNTMHFQGWPDKFAETVVISIK